ncbi:MAG TPA: alpha-L-arabinofuranosidase [Ruminococcus sp.]|nr:alpha-L-arabinofuranosidase [Ruminococcus sp.]
MKTFKKIAAAAVAAGLAVSGITVPGKADAATTVSVSPLNKYEINNGVFQGWGTSLCWWANRVGYSDTLAQKTADLFYGQDGLRMNIARFNIGGGDDPTHKHITRTDSNMPGYTVYKNGTVTYDWNADYNQRNVLLKCIQAAGDDMIVEMFSNSPPYYMTNSGCSTGNTDANKDNLRSDQYTAFAEYLAEVCYHYENTWGVDVQSIDPMNEPYTNFWGANSYKQEGCHFDQGNSESKILVELKKSMDARGMNDVIISGTDETSIDTQISSYNKLSNEAKNALGRIDTHTYGGSNRGGLRDLALSAGKNLWMSEVDSGSVAGTNAGEMGAGLWLADRIVLDCNGMSPSAWILWQAIDNHISSVGYNGNKDKGMVNVNGGYWGLAVADHDKNEVILTKKYYTFGQFSRYIRPGMTMLKCSGNSMAAYDDKNGQLVIVAVNDGSGSSAYTFDLSGFTEVGAKAQTIRTSNSESWKNVGDVALNGKTLKVDLAAQSVTTFIIDGVKGKMTLDNKIDLSKAALSGSDSWHSDSATSYSKAFDGSTSTYFDGVGSGWVQADLGQVYDIEAIGYCPRSGYEARAVDSFFQFSEDGTNWTTVATIAGQPPFGMNYITSLSGTSAARYVRYSVPEGAPQNSYNKDSVYCCNIAEIELYGVPSAMTGLTKLDPASIDGSAPYQNSSNGPAKAFDGNNASFFDGVGAGWVQADLGGLYSIDAIGFCPRKGFEARMVEGWFSVSADGENWTDIYTIPTPPQFRMNYVTDLPETTARYVRYQVPEGTPDNGYNTDNVYCCNVAEIAVFGTEAPTEPPTEPTTEPTTAPPTGLPVSLIGDANVNGSVDLTDAVAILQYTALPKKYALSEQGMINADCYNPGDGITGMDALAIQMLDAGSVKALPVYPE